MFEGKFGGEGYTGSFEAPAGFTGEQRRRSERDWGKEVAKKMRKARRFKAPR